MKMQHVFLTRYNNVRRSESFNSVEFFYWLIAEYENQRLKIQSNKLTSIDILELWAVIKFSVRTEKCRPKGFLMLLEMTHVCLILYKNRRYFFNIQYIFTIWSYWLYPRDWTSDPRATSFTILMKGFMDIITHSFSFFFSCVGLRMIFEILALYCIVGPTCDAPGVVEP